MCLLVQAHAFLSSMMNRSSPPVSPPSCGWPFREVLHLSAGALAAARLESPDLVIADVAMPGISAVDLAIQMRAQYPNCKILLFSGQATTSDLLEHARAQGYDFRLLQKPVHPSEFLSEIGNSPQGYCKPYPLRESLMPGTA
jgi:CheY-like chemotaxis protein